MIDPSTVDRMTVDVTHVIERVPRVAPLGLRFWDDVSGTTIGEGLIVTAYPRAQPDRRVRAFPNRSGLYVLRDLPGLRDFEQGEGSGAFWDSLPPRRSFIIEVVDSERRFQPFFFPADLPVRDVFVWDDPGGGSPPGTMPGVPLYSTPNRSVPAAMAVLRADLWDPGAGLTREGGPAAWAVIEARIPGRPAVRGIADERGRASLASLATYACA